MMTTGEGLQVSEGEALQAPDKAGKWVKPAVRVAALALVVSMVVSYCKDEREQNQRHTQLETAIANGLASHEENCVEENSRPLPSATNTLIVSDNRLGPVYACEYFLDMRLPSNEPTELLKVTEKDMTTGQFKQTGNIGGFLIFGSGIISGESSANGSIEEREVAVLRFTDIDGAIRTATVDRDKLKVVPCEDECQPQVTFELPKHPLWHKTYGGNGVDNSSIWMHQSPPWRYISDEDLERQQVVSQVALATDNDPEGSYTGGPDKVGQVISALTTDIIVKMPKSLLAELYGQ